MPIFKSHEREIGRTTTSGQRRGIRRRDLGRCQFPVYTEKKGWRVCGDRESPQVHHIVPRGRGGKNINRNLLTLGKRHHLGKIHPDMDHAGRTYHPGKTSFKKAVANHHELAERGIDYHVTDYDRYFAARAEEQSLRPRLVNGKAKWPWRTKTRRKKRIRAWKKIITW